jgi:hypothetical protein
MKGREERKRKRKKKRKRPTNLETRSSAEAV